MKRLLWAVVIPATVVATTSIAMAQQLAGEGVRSALGGTGSGVGIRALGMGGAYTALATDPTALYWNPAGLNAVHGFDLSVGAGATASGLSDVAEEAQTVYEAIKDDTIDSGEFDDLLDILDRVADRPRHVMVNGGAVAAAAIRRIGVGAWGEVGADANLVYSYVGTDSEVDVANSIPSTERLDVSGEALWHASVGAGVARRLSPTTVVGVGARQMEVRYRSASYTAIRVGNTVTTEDRTDEPEYEGDELAIDVGLLFTPNPNLTAGLMIRNINSPRITMTSTAGSFDVEFEPCVNVGLATQRDGWTCAMDIHNLLNANRAGQTLHLGVERRLGSNLAVRAGYSRGDVVVGLGLQVGPLSLDLAADPQLEEGAGLQLNLAF